MVGSVDPDDGVVAVVVMSLELPVRVRVCLRLGVFGGLGHNATEVGPARKRVSLFDHRAVEVHLPEHGRQVCSQPQQRQRKQQPADYPLPVQQGMNGMATTAHRNNSH